MHDAGPPLPNLAALLAERSLPREHGFEPLVVEGSLPLELSGTLYRNGPGLCELYGRPYGHLFEGDGAITAVRFADGVQGACRITESAALRAERRAGRPLYGFGRSWPRRMWNHVRGKSTKNTANTHVVSWQGRLFALMEQGRPTEIDPRDLSCRGETDLDGVIVSLFSAHPHRVASRNAAYNFGLEFGPRTRLHVYRLPDAGPVQHMAAIDLAGAPLLHDFIATDTHLVFFVSPVRLSVKHVMLQLGGFVDLFRWQPSLGTEIICVPIDRPAETVRFSVDSFFQWHFANAFDRGRAIVVDYVRYPDFSSFYEFSRPRATQPTAAGGEPAPGRYCRAEIDLDRRTLRSEERFSCDCELPRISPGVEGRAHRYCWVTLRDGTGLARLDLESGDVSRHETGAAQHVSEPIFVGADGEDPGDSEGRGYVLSLCFDAHTDRSFLAVYDAHAVDAGPRARLWFDHPIPMTFHGSWVAS